jgi:hypothetical protein
MVGNLLELFASCELLASWTGVRRGPKLSPAAQRYG